MGIDAVTCPECARKVKYGKKTCFYCGASLEGLVPTLKCKKCNTDNPDTNRFCLECGGPLLEEGQNLPVLSMIPPPGPEINLETSGVRGITFSDEIMNVERGIPPQYYQIPWKDILEINVYRLEETEIIRTEKQAKSAGKFVASLAIDTVAVPGLGAIMRAGKKKKIEETKKYKEIFICQIVTENSTELIIGDKFDYGKALDREKEFNLTNNFTKLIKKLAKYCGNITMNRGTTVLMSKADSPAWE